MPYPRRLVPALLACVAALPAVEADQPTIIVTAERLPSDAERATTTLSVITSEDIDRAGQPVQAMDHLVTVPGVELTQTGGGPGGPISIIMRGTRPHDTQVLLDGVPLSDPAAPQSNPDLAYLLPAGLQRIEVLKGAQSGLYGSRAIGGVVNLIGPRPTAGHDGSLLVEAGSFRTVRSEAVATGPLGGGIGYAATLSALDTHGFSSQATPADAGDPSGYEADGFQRYGGTLRLEVPLTSDLAAYVSGALARGRDEYDAFASPDDADSLKRLRAARLGAGLGGRIGMTDVAVDAAGTAYTREYPGNTVERYDADELYLSARARRQVHDQVSLLVGADGKRSAIDIPDSFDAHDRNLGVYTTIGYDNGRDVVDATARLDVHDREGDATTFRIGVARFAWDDRLKLHGSVATRS
jgi:vitamin B12 transporter